MVMEYVDGPTLKNLIDKQSDLPENKAVEYALQICRRTRFQHMKKALSTVI